MTRSALCITLLMASCGLAPPAATISGEIDDAAIRLDATRAAPETWLELHHVGTRACELLPVLAADPADLPIADGRVMTQLGDPAVRAEPIAAYAEVNGTPVERGDGAFGDGGWVTDVEPGDRVRLQIAFDNVPDVGDLVVLCNGPGDHEAGRYAVIAFDR